MKHLCVINPMAAEANGRVEDVVETIHDFFARNPKLSYDVHITRWKRDASGYVRRYAGSSAEMVRVYAYGGSGTLFEVVNGVMGLPNAQVAYFPLGRENSLLLALGKETKDAFSSMPNLLFSQAYSIDTIRAGNHHVLSGINIGIGAMSTFKGRHLSEQFMLPPRLANTIAELYCSFGVNAVQHYRIETDDITIEGDFAGLFIANAPAYGRSIPAPEILLNDGYMDVYTVKQIPARVLVSVLRDCRTGLYTEWPEYINHYRCNKLKLTSPADMPMTLDGEFFYNTKLNMEVLPSSLNFVCPPDVGEAFFKPDADKRTSEDSLLLEEEIPISAFLKSGAAL